MHRTRAAIVLSVIAVVAAAGVVITSAPQSGPTKQERRATDGAVIDALLLLNDDGIVLGRIAAKRATRAKLRSSALSAVDELKLENDVMRSIHKRLFGQPAYFPGGGSTIHGGISLTESGSREDPAMLHSAKPFDRQFIDMMIAVQRRTAALARTQVARGDNADLKRLAADIARRADARAARLNAWRKAWYGAGSPSMRGGGDGGSMPVMTMP